MTRFILMLLLVAPMAATAGTYMSAGNYQISFSDDLKVQADSVVDSVVEEGHRLRNKAGIESLVDVTKLKRPLIAIALSSVDVKTVRVQVGPGEVSKEEFKQTSLETLNELAQEIAGRQMSGLKQMNYTISKSSAQVGSYFGEPAIEVALDVIDPKGIRLSRNQYTIYRSSATILVIFEHKTLAGKPDHRIVESLVDDFKVLAN